jgi:transcriptional regulator with XRE-family HTH domain
MTDHHELEVKVSSTNLARGARSAGRQLHRIAEVRELQEVSLRTAARHLGTDVPTVREQEKETSDLRLSDLYRWQQVLEVPVSELLSDAEDGVSATLLHRARLVKVMKTAQAILERAPSEPIKRMAQMLVEQLTEVMPELKEVSAWHQTGTRRTSQDLGRAAQPVPLDQVVGPMD